jgi:hypothetical protein
VPPVASEATTHAHKPTLPNPARAAQNSDRPPDSPFASLLDDGTQAASEQPPLTPAASADKTARTAWSNLAQPPVIDSGAAQPGGNGPQPDNDADPATTSIAAVIVAAAGTDKAISAFKASADAKTPEPAPAGDDAKPTGDGKDGLTPADPAAVPAGDPIQAMILVAAVAPAPAPYTIAPAAPAAISQAVPTAVPSTAPATVAQAVPATVPPAAPGSVAQVVPTAVPPAAPDVGAQVVPAMVPQLAPDGVAQVVVAAAPQAAPAGKRSATDATAAVKTKPADLAALLADTGKPAAELNPPANSSSAPKGDGKPQPAADDADKQGVTQSPNEAPANTHHATAAETSPASATDTHAAAPKTAGDVVQQAAPSKSPARRWPARTASKFASIRPSSAASRSASTSAATATSHRA